MSIPPLVCSTPPPPDQCEDERDIEDFDTNYNLSQEDEEDGNDYNFGYSDYIYPTSSSTNIQERHSPDISKKAEIKLSNELLSKNSDSISILPECTSSNVNKLGFEDIAIEDLNLKVEDENDLTSSKQNLKTCDTESNIDYSGKEVNTSMHDTNDINKSDDLEECILPEDFSEADLVNNVEKLFEDNIPYMETTFLEKGISEPYDISTQEKNIAIEKNDAEGTYVNNESCTIDANEMETKLPYENTNVLESNLEQESLSGVDSKLTQEELNVNISIKDPNTLESKINDTVDEFDDFDDFQFTSSENKAATTIDYCDNPWDSEVSKDCQFGDFTANFDGNEINLHSRSNVEVENKDTAVDDDTDDFGDFDDFKSSSNENKDSINQTQPSQNVPDFSLYSPDSEVQVIESINSVLSSIFSSEISEEESAYEPKIESLLSETWGHLVDTDIRQPYIVNWNNSLGQKSLLKALCIDSRNILFGPKWNNGMPKYAANLTVAPLQPQKPFATTNSTHVEEQNVDKNVIKENSTWRDPFTSDGQESCNTESGTSSGITRPTNLDMFTNVVPTKMDKIYSPAVNVQPIRQINLPDTHIFTPTDSETPRSKTIHYDHGSNILVSQASGQSDESTTQPNSQMTIKNSDNDEDYWEFQDFKGPVKNKNETFSESKRQVTDKTDVSTKNNSTLQMAVNYETQILQPIKVEPIMPALNWPAPGEVKETFDDFSEFISSTAWNENNIVNATDHHLNSKQDSIIIPKTQTIDDDFETFQSAPTLTTIGAPIETIHKRNINQHNFNDFPQNYNEINEIPHNRSTTDSINKVKSEESFAQNQVPITAFNNITTVKDTNVKSSPVLSSVNKNVITLLEPSIAGTSGSQRNQKKTGQILQPLSLESYSQINWPNPGIDLQDLSRFNPVESLQSLKSDVSTGSSSKLASPAHKDITVTRNEIPDEDIWGDFVSSNSKQQSQTKKLTVFADDDEWTDFVSSPSIRPQNGLNTISLNVHTNLNMQKNSNQSKFPTKSNQIVDIPTLNYVTPKSTNRGVYNEKHFQNL